MPLAPVAVSEFAAFDITSVPPADAVVVAPSFQARLEAALFPRLIIVADVSSVTVKLFNHTSSFELGVKTVVPFDHGEVATLVSDQLPDRKALTFAILYFF
jgi:hypothetical protein